VSLVFDFDFNAKANVFRIFDLWYKFYLNHLPAWKGKIRGIKIYCHFVLNPNITTTNGTLTYTTLNQIDWCDTSLRYWFKCENKFFAFMTSDTSSIWTTFRYERVKSEASKFIGILSWIRILPSKMQLSLTTPNQIDRCESSLRCWFKCENKSFSSDTSSTWTIYRHERVKSEASKFIATLSWIRILPS